MNAKLTLSLNKTVIEKAKEYAKEQNVSLSFLIENYLQKISSTYVETSPPKGSIVDELGGIIKLDDELDYKEEYTAYLTKKYK